MKTKAQRLVEERLRTHKTSLTFLGTGWKLARWMVEKGGQRILIEWTRSGHNFQTRVLVSELCPPTEELHTHVLMYTVTEPSGFFADNWPFLAIVGVAIIALLWTILF